MLLILNNLFDRLFGNAAKSVASAAQAKVERETVGKAEAKVVAQQQKMQQKALRSMDKVGPDMLKKKGDKPGPVPVNAPPPMAMAAPVGGQAMAGQLTCPNGHPLDPTWEVCPYCRSAAQQGVRAALVQPAGAASSAKTMAIDISQIAGSQHVNKAVVGWIVCMLGQQKGQDFRLHDGRNVMGTAADCDIVIFDPYLSARHAVFLVESGKSSYILQDLDSRNGTYVNRQRVMKVELVDNDEIRFGQAEFRFKALY